MLTKAIKIAAHLLEAEDDWRFTTKVNYRGHGPNIDITGGTQNDDEDVDSAEGTVTWSVDFEVRSWGIKDITPHVESVDIVVTFGNIETREDRQVHIQYPHVKPATKGEEDIDGYLAGLDKGWSLDWKIEPFDVYEKGMSLAVNSVELDFRKRSIHVAF